MTQAMFYGSCEMETYSHISTYTTGSYYDQMKDSVLSCVDKVIDRRLHEGCDMLSIGDFGTAEGVNFLSLLENITEMINFKSKDIHQTMVYLNDMSNNDFNLLFAKVTNSAFSKNQNVFFAAVGKSMYKQCLPKKSLDIALSSCSLHWLSTTPCTIKDGLGCIHASELEKEMFQEQARKDWKNFLISRGLEMKNGGFLIVLVLVMETEEHGRRVFGCVSDAWRRMYNNRKINYEEYEKTTLGLYTERTEEDLRSAFHDTEICDLGLQPISIERRTHYHKPLQRVRENQDKMTAANAEVDCVRPWLRNIIYHGLSEERSMTEKEMLCEEYFQILVSMAMEGQLKCEYLPFVKVIIEKV